ncbi:MAG: aminoglycoside 6-adenylyltransferase [bacterium]
MHSENLNKIIQWAEDKENIRALIITGSLASKGKRDILSDYDIALFGNRFEFIGNDEWLTEIADFLICVHDEFDFLGYQIPTRLTIFDENFKADFSFHPLEILKKLSSAAVLPDAYNIGCKVLIDKDNALSKMPVPTFEGFKIKKPDPSEFKNNINEFWFEVYHVGKYLYRNDLWTAKLRDAAVKEKLLQMIGWNHASKCNWSFGPKNLGKGMKDWIDNSLWDEFNFCFGKFEKNDSLNALKNTIKLYRKITIETAKYLGYDYNFKLDESITKFVDTIK